MKTGGSPAACSLVDARGVEQRAHVRIVGRPTIVEPMECFHAWPERLPKQPRMEDANDPLYSKRPV